MMERVPAEADAFIREPSSNDTRNIMMFESTAVLRMIP
jgi:hypothetical protein